MSSPVYPFNHRFRRLYRRDATGVRSPDRSSVVLGIVFLLGNLHLLPGRGWNVVCALLAAAADPVGVIKLTSISKRNAMAFPPRGSCRRNLSRHSHRRLWAHRHQASRFNWGEIRDNMNTTTAIWINIFGRPITSTTTSNRCPVLRHRLAGQ